MSRYDEPNLDGDFVTLNEIKEKRKRAAAEKQHVPQLEFEMKILVKSEHKDFTSFPEICTNNNGTYSDNTREQVLEAIEKEDNEYFVKLCDEFTSDGQSLMHESMVDPTTKENMLHTALIKKKMAVAKALMEHGPTELLTNDYEVQVKGHVTNKSTLHLLVENGNLELIKVLLDKIKHTKDVDDYLRRCVLMEVEGQRARDFQAIHLAALHGHTSILEYLISQGVSVNTVNNKNDTPVLWAARNNHIDSVRSLINLGADLVQQNDKGSTPLYWACRYGLLDMVKVLLMEGKADVHQQRKLGLVSPVVLVSAYGYTEILKELISHGADVNLKIQGGFTPIHYASQYGNLETVKLLIEKGAITDAENDFGDTPLLLAAREEECDIADLLSSHNASFDIRNNDGKCVWNYAIESKATKLLTKIIKHSKSRNNGRLHFSKDISPLHLAATRGDVAKIRCLLDSGANSAAVDEGGNTFFHTAAMHDNCEVVQSFCDSTDLNKQNTNGDTPLHLAAYLGNMKALKLLLELTKLEIKNNKGETALHAACKMQCANPDVVTLVVDTIFSKHNWSLVNEPDIFGNTALHLAANTGKVEILDCLKQLNPRITNALGDSPAMIAVKSGRVNVLEEMLLIYKENISVNIQNKDGKSMLHVAIEQALPDMVKLLVLAGVDLSIKDLEGNTPLHTLVDQTIKQKENIVNLNTIHTFIEDYALNWWISCLDRSCPEESSPEFNNVKRDALLHLYTNIPNNNGFSVLMYAAKNNAIDIFAKIIQTKKVFMDVEENEIHFDISNMMPNTIIEKVTRKTTKRFSTNSVMPVLHEDEQNDHPVKDSVGHSYLELILQSSNPDLANKMLDITPVKQIVDNYWSAYQWIFGTIMVIHILYMTLLSHYAIPDKDSILHPFNDTIIEIKGGSVFPFVLFLIWPLAMLLFVIYRGTVHLRNFIRKGDKFFDIEQFTSQCMWNFLKDNLNTLNCFLFAMVTFVWYFLYLHDSLYQVYLLSIALLSGWLITVIFTSGFESVHTYNIIIKEVILRDIIRFMVLYLFILLAFSFAFYALFTLATEMVDQYPSIWKVFLIVFNMLNDVGQVLDLDFDSYYQLSGYSIAAIYIKLVYLVYIILTGIITLTLLVAMINSSYKNVKEKEVTNWRVESIKLAMQLERIIPAISLLRPNIYKIRFEPNTLRYMMTIPKAEYLLNCSENEDNEKKFTRKFEKEMLEIRSKMQIVASRLQLLHDKIKKL